MNVQTIMLTAVALTVTGLALYNLYEKEPTNKYMKEFINFKTQFNKVHGSQLELEYRLAVFSENMKFAEEHNQQGLSYTLGVNQFADLTFEEFKSGYLSEPVLNEVFDVEGDEPTGKDIDWVKKGIVSPVKNQQMCGSCWAFSTTGSFEAAYKLKNNKEVLFSEQELVDCSGKYGNMGCNGGIMANAYEYIKDNQLGKEADYPYTAKQGTCSKKSGDRFSVQGYEFLSQANVQGLADALQNQPVSVAIEARRDFQMYHGGIYQGAEDCGHALNHGVLAVGFGTEGNSRFFKVKNSWGSQWGEEGYVRMAAGTGSGCCGIANQADVYPKL